MAVALDDSTDKGGGATAKRWISEIENSEKWRRAYWDRCAKIIQRYRNEWAVGQTEAADPARKFAILWANIQTLGPAVYAKTPEAVVTRRFKDEDPLGRIAAEVLERAANFSVSAYDFDGAMVNCRDDYLLLGQGQLWARYVPHFKKPAPKEDKPGEEAAEGDIQVTNDQDDPDEEVVDYEEVLCDHLAYDDFGTNPARTWDEVWYVWRRAFLTREELVARFGKEKGDACPLDWDPAKDDRVADPDRKGLTPKAAIYEIWDKKRRKAIWISKGYNADTLDERDDPLGLSTFFPCPRPLLATTSPISIVPIPDYVYYQDQAEEIDELTARIGVLTDALQLHGVYDGSQEVTLQNVFQNPSNYLIPVDNWAMLKDSGGMKGVIEWFPIENVAAALTACVELRKQLLEDVYQLTGISDIMRGATDPEETAAAQGIKATWGSLRVRDRQKEIARFARDVIRIKAEIIAEKFAPETLQAMTGVKLFPDPQAKQQAQEQLQAQAQMQARMAQMTGQPPQPPQIPEDMQQMLAEPTWAEVMQLLKSNGRRAFSVDIETDSTIEPDEQESKQRLVEYTTAVSQLLTAAGPILMAFPPAAPMFGEIMKESARVFRVNRNLEEVIDRVFGQFEKSPPQMQQPAAKAGPPPPDPVEQQAKLITATANQTKAQAALLTAQSGAQAQAMGTSQEQEAHALEQQRTQTDAALGVAQLHLDAKSLDLKEKALNKPKPQGTT